MSLTLNFDRDIICNLAMASVLFKLHMPDRLKETQNLISCNFELDIHMHISLNVELILEIPKPVALVLHPQSFV